MAEKREASLPDVMQKFDKSVLLFHDPKTGGFVPDEELDQEDVAPSFLVRALQAFLTSARPFETVDLVRSIARRQQRGINPIYLVRDICAATVKIIDRRDGRIAMRGTNSRSGLAPTVTPDNAFLLWAAMFLVFASRSEWADLEANNAEFLFDFHELCRDFSRRATASRADPMAGLWSDLKLLMTQPDLGGHRTSTDDLLQSMRSLPVLEGTSFWFGKCQRLLAGPQPLESSLQSPVFTEPPLDLPRLGNVIGNAKVVGALRRRFVDDRHATPLTIIGPEGSGKKTMARLYAKALLCEHRGLSEAEACRACAQRGRIDEHAGFVMLDLAKESAVQNVRDVLDQLRFYPILSDRRVVVITGTENAQNAIDAFLKTFESGKYLTTFIVLGCDEKSIRSTILSRSEIWRLSPLDRNEARALTRRWMRSRSFPVDVLDLIGLHGRRLPGPMMRVCNALQQAMPATLAEAKVYLGLDWGDKVIRYWCSLLGASDPATDELNPLRDIDTLELLQRVRIVLCHLGQTQEVSEAALLGLEEDLEHTRILARQRAYQCEISSETLWDDLALHWQADSIIHRESFFCAGIQARKIVTTVRSSGS